MRRADMLVSVRQRKLACVLDPALVLASPWGTTLALRLTQVTEPWLTRSFWQLIDASELVLPALAIERAEPQTAPPANLNHPAASALLAWIELRDSTDAASWPFRWVGDNLAQSQVGGAADDGIVERYEQLAEGLQRRFGAHQEAPGQLSLWWDPLVASLDTLALSASLCGALVISAQRGTEPPWPVAALERVGVPTQHLDPPNVDSLFAAERTVVREALALAGLACVSECLPRLLALHVLADFAEPSRQASLVSADDAEEEVAQHKPQADPWNGAQAWWFYV